MILFKFFENLSYLFFCLVGTELIRGIGFAEQRMGNIIVVLFKYGYLAIFNEVLADDTLALNTVKQVRNKLNVADLFHLEGDVIASLKLNAADIVFCGVFLYILAQSAEGASSKPREEAPGVAAEVHQGVFQHTRCSCGRTSLI